MARVSVRELAKVFAVCTELGEGGRGGGDTGWLSLPTMFWHHGL